MLLAFESSEQEYAGLAGEVLSLLQQGYQAKDIVILQRHRAGLAPLTLGPKEGLALLNGTQVSTALALAALSCASDAQAPPRDEAPSAGSVEAAIEFPVRLLESGPAGGDEECASGGCDGVSAFHDRSSVLLFCGLRGESAAGGLLILGLHIGTGLAHRLYDLVERHVMRAVTAQRHA